MTQPGGGDTTYTYDALGEVLSVTSPLTVTTSSTARYVYDLRGRKICANDPDMGGGNCNAATPTGWFYGYDSMGRLVSQTDRMGRTATMRYDQLGRMIKRIEADPANSSGNMTATWTYGIGGGKPAFDNQANYPNSAGKLVEEGCTGAACGEANAFDRLHKYDPLGRQVELDVTTGAFMHFTTTAYDATTGKIAEVRAFSGMTLDYGYNRRGYLATLSAPSGLEFWKATAEDAEGHVTDELSDGELLETTHAYDPNSGRMLNVCAEHAGGACDLANLSTVFDSNGNLMERDDTLEGTSEYSCYDVLNRLQQTGFYAPGTAPASGGTLCGGGAVSKVNYDLAGDITFRTGMGGYSYDGTGPAGPHAVTSVAGSVNGVAAPTFRYDADGEMLADAGRALSYTSFGMTASVSQGTASDVFTYDCDHRRAEKVETVGGVSTTTRYYNDPAANVVSEQQQGGGVTTWINYIVVEGRIVAMRTTVAGQSKAPMSYMVTDHLGSVAVVIGDAGHVQQRNFYDAWGLMRNMDGSVDPNCALPAAAVTASGTTRGYTGQEQMPGMCLANYNARLYDPALGKFLSADPSDGSGTNRYWYVGDNPLSLTDPTGLCFLGCFWQSPFGKAAIGVAIGIVLQEFALPALEAELSLTVSTTVNAGIAGGVAGYATTGKLKGALISGVAAVGFAEAMSAFSGASDAAGTTATKNVAGPASADGGAQAASNITAENSAGAPGYASPSSAADFAKAGTSAASNFDPSRIIGADDFAPINLGIQNGVQAYEQLGQGWSLFERLLWNAIPGAGIVDCIEGGCGFWGWAMAAGGVIPDVGALRELEAFKYVRALRAGEDEVVEPTLVIGRGADLSESGALDSGEASLRWTPTGNAQSEWKINSGLLRTWMNDMQPIRDASPGDTGGMYLNAERNLLTDRGWTFNPKTSYWMPPKG